jgi:hypothetical protein
MTAQADGFYVVAPRVLILPSENTATGTARTPVSGEIFISGNVLFYMSGTQLRKVTAT